MVKGIIYEFRNTINNKYYVGQTINPNSRYYAHKKAKGDSYFHRAIRKYGFDKFEYKVVNEYEASDVYELKDILNDAETKQIDYRDSYNNGYNCTTGGDGIVGYEFSEEQRKYISTQVTQAMKNTEIRSKISEGMKGKSPWNKGKTNIYSDVTLKKMRVAKRGKSTWNKGKKGLYKHSKDTRKKQSCSLKIVLNTEEYKNKMSSIMKNRVWISNDTLHETRFIKQTELQSYIDDGWVLGRKKYK